LWHTTEHASANMDLVVAPLAWNSVSGAVGPVNRAVGLARRHTQATAYMHTMGNFTSIQLLRPKLAIERLHNTSLGLEEHNAGIGVLIRAVDGILSRISIPTMNDFTPPRLAALEASCGTADTTEQDGLEDIHGIFEELRGLSYALDLGTPHVVGMQNFMLAALSVHHKLSELPSSALDEVTKLQRVLDNSDVFMQQWLQTQSSNDVTNLTSAVDTFQTVSVPALRNATIATKKLPSLVRSLNASLAAATTFMGLLELEQLDSFFAAVASLGADLPPTIEVAQHMVRASAISTSFNNQYDSAFRDESYDQVVQRLKDRMNSFAERASDLLIRARGIRGVLGGFTTFIGDLPGIGEPSAAITDFVLGLVDDVLSVATRIEALLRRAASMTRLEERVAEANTMLGYMSSNATLGTTVVDVLTELNAKLEGIWGPAHRMASLASTWANATRSVHNENEAALAHVRQYGATTAASFNASVILSADFQRALEYDNYVISTLAADISHALEASNNATAFEPAIHEFDGFTSWRAVAAEVTEVDMTERLAVFKEATITLIRDQPTITEAMMVQHCVPSIECARDRFVTRLRDLKLLGVLFLGPLRRSWHSTSVASSSFQSRDSLTDESEEYQGPQALRMSARRLFASQAAVEVMVDTCNAFTLSSRPMLQTHAQRLMPAHQRAVVFVDDTLPTLQTRVGHSLKHLTRVAAGGVASTQQCLAALTTAHSISVIIVSTPTFKALLAAAAVAPPTARAFIAIASSDAMSTALSNFELLAVPARIFAVFSESIDVIVAAFEWHVQLLSRLRAALASFHRDVQDFLSDLDFSELKSGPLATVESLAPACNNFICLRVYERSPDVYRKVVFPVRFLRFCSLATPALFSPNKASLCTGVRAVYSD